MRSLLFFSSLVGISLLLSPGVGASDRAATIRGEARHPKTQELVYIEDHTLFREANGKLLRIETVYFKDGNTQPIARMRTNFQEAPSEFFPSYKYEDLRRQVSHEVRRIPGSPRQVELSRESPKGRKSAMLDVQDNMVAGQGILIWLERELPRLMARERLHVRFVLPAFLDDYGFEAFQLRKVSDSIVTLQVRLDHWFFRLFSSPIEVDMHVQDQRFVAYRGPGNVMGENGKPQNLHIQYSETPVKPAALATETLPAQNSADLSTVTNSTSSVKSNKPKVPKKQAPKAGP